VSNNENDAGTRRDNVRSVAIGSDHGSVDQKAFLVRFLELLRYRVVDVGCFGAEKVDYPDIAVAVCRRVVSGDCERGIVDRVDIEEGRTK
jgi:ribose 5-phosphate isomerase RpiB